MGPSFLTLGDAALFTSSDRSSLGALSAVDLAIAAAVRRASEPASCTATDAAFGLLIGR